MFLTKRVGGKTPQNVHLHSRAVEEGVCMQTCTGVSENATHGSTHTCPRKEHEIECIGP